MGMGNLREVRGWTGKTGHFGTRPVQQPELLPCGGPNLYPYPLTTGLCRAWLHASVPISSPVFQISLFIIAFRHATVNLEKLTLVRLCRLLMDWLPWWSRQTATCSLCRPENEGQRNVNNCWSCILGQLGGDRLQIVINEVLAAHIGKRERETLSAVSWKWVSMEHQQLLALHHD